MPYYSNAEIATATSAYEPAYIDESGKCHGPRCCGRPMADNGGCSAGCCDDYKCDQCGHTVRIEWPD